MKQIIIKIPENAYNRIRKYYENNEIVEATYSYIYHGTVLPENPTNGEMIETMFAAIKEIHAMTRTVFVVLHDGAELEFDRNWWNSPYEAKEQSE